MERVQGANALLRLLINDYFKGSGTTHHTQLDKTFTHKKKFQQKKEYNKRKLSMPVLNKGMPKFVLSCPIISRGKMEGVRNKFLYGEAPPEDQPLALLYTVFHEKGTPLISYKFCGQIWYPFDIPSLELFIQSIVI